MNPRGGYRCVHRQQSLTSCILISFSPLRWLLYDEVDGGGDACRVVPEKDSDVNTGKKGDEETQGSSSTLTPEGKQAFNSGLKKLSDLHNLLKPEEDDTANLTTIALPPPPEDISMTISQLPSPCRSLAFTLTL